MGREEEDRYLLRVDPRLILQSQFRNIYRLLMCILFEPSTSLLKIYLTDVIAQRYVQRAFIAALSQLAKYQLFKKEKRYIVVWKDSKDLSEKSERTMYNVIHFKS